MLLSPSDAEQFFRLHRTLMFFVNQRLRVIPDDPGTPEQFSGLPPPVRLTVRDALVGHPELIESFIEENPARLTPEELDVVQSWRHFVAGRFYAFRELKAYTVFLSADDPAVAYGVLALSQPFEELIGPYLPVLVQTVLLPLRGKIVYDGLLNSYRVTFGPGIRRSLNDSYRQAKNRHGIVTSLPMSETSTVALAKPSRPASRSRAKPSNPFVGRWRITHVDEWDQDFVNAEVEGFVQFDDDGGGRFQFGYVHGHMDCRRTTRDGEPAVEWTWDGNDEMDPAQGRGWAVVRGNELHGMIYFHQGDESGFVAKRSDGSKRKTRK